MSYISGKPLPSSPNIPFVDSPVIVSYLPLSLWRQESLCLKFSMGRICFLWVTAFCLFRSLSFISKLFTDSHHPTLTLCVPSFALRMGLKVGTLMQKRNSLLFALGRCNRDHYTGPRSVPIDFLHRPMETAQGMSPGLCWEKNGSLPTSLPVLWESSKRRKWKKPQ